MAPSVDYADPELPPQPTIEAVAAPRPSGPVDSPWERLEAQRTEIETVKPPDEVLRPAGPPGIICPACRTENEASRRFCQSCGTPLVVTTPTQTVTSQPIARRSMRWLAILIPIVIVAGVVGFAGAAILKGLPGASATPGPTASSVVPSAATPSGSTTAPTASAGGPVAQDLRPFSIIGSSKKDQDHSTGKSIDIDPATKAPNTMTSWQADTLGGKQIWIEVTFRGSGIADLTRITVTGGDQRSPTAFNAARRPRHIEFSADGGKPVTVELANQFGAQDFAVKIHVTTRLRITIIDNYPGLSSTFSGISDIRFLGSQP